MSHSAKILAFIGARAGSKGFPGKNTAMLGGKPLVSWSIEAGMNSELVTDTLVSSDSDEVIAIAKEWGALAPFKRPDELAGDTAAIEDAVCHALAWLRDHQDKTYDLVVLLQPTSPFRTHLQVDEAIRHYFDNRASVDDTLISVEKAPQKSAWLLASQQAGKVSFCLPQPETGRRRQHLPQLYYPNGAIFIAKADFEPRSYFSENTWFYEMSADDSVDIDSASDLEKAEVIMANRNG